MKSTCILCRNPAGHSREHVLPAALGGRRKDKGIYCATHNGELSPLVSVLAAQLEVFNAFLAVRPDRSKEARRLEVEHQATGENYSLSGADLRFAKPKVLRDVMANGQREMTMAFSDERQWQEWLEAVRKQGFQVSSIKMGQPLQHAVTVPLKVELKLGGPVGLRSVGYVALSHLAHYFPAVARDAALDAFKEYVLGDGAGRFVGWDFSAESDKLPPNTYQFGHRIVLGLDADRGQAYAHVILFSTLAWGVRFGAAAIAESETKVIDINPLADYAPDDVTVRDFPSSLVPVESFPEPPTYDYIPEGQVRISRFLRGVEELRWNAGGPVIVAELNAARSLNGAELESQVRRILAGQDQLLLNLMTFVADEFASAHAAQAAENPLIPVIEAALRAMTAADSQSGTGLTTESRAGVALVREVLAFHISQELRVRDLGLDELRQLLKGGVGAALVAQAMLAPVFEQLGIPLSELGSPLAPA